MLVIRYEHRPGRWGGRKVLFYLIKCYGGTWWGGCDGRQGAFQSWAWAYCWAGALIGKLTCKWSISIVAAPKLSWPVRLAASSYTPLIIRGGWREMPLKLLQLGPADCLRLTATHCSAVQNTGTEPELAFQHSWCNGARSDILALCGVTTMTTVIEDELFIIALICCQPDESSWGSSQGFFFV